MPCRPYHEYLRNLLKQHESMDVLARRTALRPGNITTFETDDIPDEAMLHYLAAALNVPVDLLRTTNPI